MVVEERNYLSHREDEDKVEKEFDESDFLIFGRYHRAKVHSLLLGDPGWVWGDLAIDSILCRVPCGALSMLYRE